MDLAYVPSEPARALPPQFLVGSDQPATIQRASIQQATVATYGTLHVSGHVFVVRIARSQETLEQQVKRLADAWRRDTRVMSSIDDITTNQNYRDIVNLGTPVVPLLIKDLIASQRSHWHTALCEITGENPIAMGRAGDHTAIVRAWMRWWEDHKHLFQGGN